MILGVGIDIIEVKRVEEKIARNRGFKEKVFSKSEIEYCESNQNGKYQHYAARFAAKEAFLKASGKGLQLSHDLQEIVTYVNSDGKPMLLISSQIKESLSVESLKIHVSLSHLESTACAVVVLETMN
jgi:holo-[acyl-carrier protein] synthase